MSINFQCIYEWLESRYSAIGVELAATQESVTWTVVDDTRVDLGDFELGLLTRFVVLSDPAKAAETFQSEVRWALGAASHFDYRSSITEDQSDPFGAWQVQLVWVVTKETKESWLACMRELRARSAHAEEIGLELIDLSCQDLSTALKCDGIPSLMFKVRELLRKSAADMPAWVSPDLEVESRLRALAPAITDREQREFSSDFLSRVLSSESTEQVTPQILAPTLGLVRIRNVRNIEEAEIAISTNDYAAVIHGPNGTGKSSLFEAICIALLGTSKRHVEFLEDKDVLQSIRTSYANQVLRRFGSDVGPSITMDDRDVLAALESSHENAHAKLVAGRGTVLAQESAREFVAMSASELASYVLGDYSELARRVQEQVEQGAQVARADWQNWLRSYGLNASISKSDTILRRLVEKVLQSDCPPEPPGPLTWLKGSAEVFPEFLERVEAVKNRWEDLDGTGARGAVVDQVSAAIQKIGNAERSLAGWLSDRAEVSAQILDLIGEVSAASDVLRQDWASTKTELIEWGNWLEAPSKATETSLSRDIEDGAAPREAQIRVRLEALTPVGQRLRARKEHLSGIVSGFLSSWEEASPHICPTCDATHEDIISKVVARVLAETASEYDKLRAEFSELQMEARSLRAQVSAGAGSCPISSDRQRELAALLRFSAEGPDSLETHLRSSDARSTLFGKIERTFAAPSWKAPASSDSIVVSSSEISSRIIELRAEGAFKQELPIRWDHLKKSVDVVALEVVGNHLPQTIGALWREISLILAPAYWIQACAPEMAMELRRGSEKLGVIVRRDEKEHDIPARHILNQAEQHVLGLAWFFTRFLTHGRFFVPLVALDDPAQEMDQVTFRKFARFVQAFQRAHRYQAKKLGVLVFLHQEERAIEFARSIADSASLTVLDWSATVRSVGPKATVRTVQLRNSQQRARPYAPSLTKLEPIASG